MEKVYKVLVVITEVECAKAIQYEPKHLLTLSERDLKELDEFMIELLELDARTDTNDYQEVEIDSVSYDIVYKRELSLAEYVSRHMNRHGLLQKDIEEKYGIPRPTLFRVLNNRTLGVSTKHKVAKLLGCKYEELPGGHDNV